MPKVFEHRLIEEFKERESFSRDELYSFFRYFEPNLKEGTLGWRIYDLKEKNILRSVRRGWYVISYKPKYKPELSKEILQTINNTSFRQNLTWVCSHSGFIYFKLRSNRKAI